VTASIVALAAPGESPSAAPKATEVAVAERPAPVLRPLPLAPAPIWNSEASFDRGDAGDAVIRDGLALVTGSEHLVALDVATGEVRWSLENGEELDGGNGDTGWSPNYHVPPQLVGTEDGLAVPVEYYRPGREEVGLALLSAEDGSVVWQRAMGTAPETQRTLWAVDDRVALTTEATKEGSLTTVAFDIRTGDELWDAADVWPATIIGDTAVMISSAESLEDPWGVYRMPKGDLAGVDLVTGEPRWDLGDRFEWSGLVLTAGDVVLVQASENDARDLKYVLVHASGEVLGAFQGNFGCATDGSTLIACPDLIDSGVRVFDLASRELTFAPVDGIPPPLDGVVAGRMVLEDDGGFHSIDRFGNRIDESLPSGVVAASDTHVLFRAMVEERREHVISLHPLAG
jgi:outer membrane protein assembly factor BamB